MVVPASTCRLTRRNSVAVQCCRRLAHPHSHRVTHGDVKPENILSGSDGSARLGDFDIASESRTTTQYRQLRLTTLAGAFAHKCASRTAEVSLGPIASTGSHVSLVLVQPLGSEAFTSGFDAPELTTTGGSAASDMFSFGRTVEAVFKAWLLSEPNHSERCRSTLCAKSVFSKPQCVTAGAAS